MRLVVTEKPSVARDLARVLGVRGKHEGFLEGEGLRITWCFGHLVELQEPSHYDGRWKRWSFDTLPMVPERFDLRLRKGVSKHWKVVRRLLRDPEITEVVNACDAGREGELIFRYVYDFAESQAPVVRLWLSSLTDQAIHQGWRDLRPGARYDALADAARCRSEADWLVGLNATRAMTCLARKGGGDQLLSVGRVQTPTLAMIVARDRAIEAFVPETFWQVEAVLSAGDDATWKGRFFREVEAKAGRDEVPHAERLPTAEAAGQVAKAAQGRQGVLEQSERRRQTEAPPLLYDLTSLQRRANQRYGFNASKSLELAQALYEKHKLITYPRTDARFLTPDQVGELPEILRGLGQVDVYRPFTEPLLDQPLSPGKRVIDASEVGDHHAIIPTGRPPTTRRLSPDEKRLFDLVARRFMAALSPEAVFERTTLIVAVDPDDAPLPDGIEAPLRFRAKGKVCLEEGWQAVDPPKRRREVLLPRVDEGATAQVDGADPVEGQTRPPRPHNDASLLKGMETAGKDLDDRELKRAMRNAGLGTPATRAAILQTLVDRGFVLRNKREIRATDRGRALIDAVPVDELKSAELTARYEARLSDIAERRDSRAAFMADVAEHVQGVVSAIATAEPPPAEVVQRDTPVLGQCPACDTPVQEGRGAYSCGTGRECPFVVFKTMSGRAISATMVKALLRDGRTKPVKGFKSRKGKPFRAGLQIGDDHKVGFWFPDRRDGDRPPSKPEAEGPVGRPCPRCGEGRLIAGKSAWGCGRWRDGCRFVLPFEVDGRRLSDGDAVARLASMT